MLEDMKTDILNSLAMNMDTIQLKMKRGEVEKALAIFYPRCRKNHEKNECPLDIVEVCAICANKNQTEKFPSYLL